MEFVPGTGRSPRTAQTQEAKGDTSKSQAQGGENAAQTKKEQRRNTWMNEDGSIRPISKWSGVNFTDKQKAYYVAGKAVKLENVTDKQGFHATMYICLLYTSLFIVLNFLVSKLVGEESGVGTQNGEERSNLFP